MIHVLATVDVVSGRRDDFLAEFRKVMPLVRAEEGCLEYGPAIDTPTGFPAQNPLRENTVVIVEKWESLPALKAHLDAPHMHEYRRRVKDLVKSVTLQILEPV
jgi:quinol monooxygenase YgiN